MRTDACGWRSSICVLVPPSQLMARHTSTPPLLSGIASSAVRALEGRGLKPENIIGIGVDGTAQAVGELKKKEITGFVGTVVLQPKLHGYAPCVAMYQWITEGAQPPKLTTTSGVLVDRSNYAAKMQELGLKVP